MRNTENSLQRLLYFLSKEYRKWYLKNVLEYLVVTRVRAYTSIPAYSLRTVTQKLGNEGTQKTRYSGCCISSLKNTGNGI